MKYFSEADDQFLKISTPIIKQLVTRHMSIVKTTNRRCRK